MHTKDLSIFSQMTKIAKDQNLDYRIMYSYRKRTAPNGLTETYRLILCTNLFSINYEENLSPDNTNAINDFLKYNSEKCIELPFEIRIDGNNIELKN